MAVIQGGLTAKILIMKRSKFLKLKWWDIVKGAIVAGVTTLITMFITMLNTGVFPTTWDDLKPMLIAALAAFLAYVLKNWLTNNEGKIAKPDNHKTVGVPDTTTGGREQVPDPPTTPDDQA